MNQETVSWTPVLLVGEQSPCTGQPARGLCASLWGRRIAGA